MRERIEGARWPSPKWQKNPVGFCEQILGVKPEPEQVTILEAVRDYDRVAVSAGQKVAKALALDTPIPTPDGWTTMGALREGDVVVDDRGLPTRVLAASEVFTGRQCFLMIFDDGTEIICSGDHQWLTTTAASRRSHTRAKQPRIAHAVVTTSEIAASVQSVSRGYNHSIEPCGPMQCAERRFLIDPYVLGAWLGDGHSACGNITIGDREIARAIEGRGYRLIPCNAQNAGKATTYKILRKDGYPFMRLLRRLGVLRNKHVPAPYLRGSEEQRRDLLAGLLDTDGTSNPRGASVGFTNKRERLVDAVVELARSLGFKPTKRSGRAKLYGRDCGAAFHVSFTPHAKVFRVRRKQARTIRARPKPCANRRAIVSVSQCKSVPVRCVAVDSPSHLFLCSRAFIPTHNTTAIVILALWWYCSFRNARVIPTARTDYQVNRVVYRELTRIVREYERKHGRHTLGLLGETARSGLTSHDLREIRGSTVRDVEAVSGVSGGDLFHPEDPPAILYLVDEASALPGPIYEAMVGNLMGGGKLAMFSQPTRNEGPFFEAFHEHRDAFWTWTIDAEKVAKRNAAAGHHIPGIATLESVGAMIKEYGRESAFVQIRVFGKFVKSEVGKINAIATIIEAQDAWKEHAGGESAQTIKLSAKDGRLHVGVDPAGPGPGGDESTFAPRRRKTVLPITARRGLTEEGHLVVLLEILRELADPREEIPIVKIDREGEVGTKVYAILAIHLQSLAPDVRPPFVLVAIRSSQPAEREPMIYGTIRDELWGSCSRWLRDGGEIPPDGKLAKELHAPSWAGDIRGKQKATPKEELRKVGNLGRSPDRADALCLAVWEMPGLEAPKEEGPPKAAPVRIDYPHLPDPYDIADKSYPR